MAAKNPQDACKLLSIPAEIRWILYRLLFDGIRIQCERSKPTFTQSPYFWLHLQMPAEFDVLLTCRQLLHEGQKHFYQQATFDLSSMASYEIFFDALPPSTRSQVRAIQGLKFTRGVQVQSLPSMKPSVVDMDRWLPKFTSLSRMTVAIDTVVTLQEERFHGIRSVDDITFEDLLEIIVSPVTSTGRPKWSLEPLVDLIEKHPNIDFTVILKLRTMAPYFDGVRSIDKMVVHLDVQRRSVRLADLSFSEGVFVADEPQIQTRMSGAVSAGRGGRRIAYTRGGIFAF